STLLSNGPHQIHVTATDTSSNKTATQTHTFTVDNTGPTIVSFTPAEGAIVRGPGIAVTGDATDVGGGVASMTFTIDNGAVVAPVIDGTAPYATTFDSRVLTDGTHTINVIATDVGGNTTLVQTHYFKVDNTVPVQPHFTNVLAPFTGATT